MNDSVLLAFFAANASVEDYSRHRIYSSTWTDGSLHQQTEEGKTEVYGSHGESWVDSVETARFKYAREMLKQLKKLDNVMK